MGQHDGPPEGVYYFRIYGTIMAIISALLAGGGMVMAVTSILTPASPSSYSSNSELVVGIVYAAMGSAFFIPYLIALLGGRKSWVHTLATVLIALSMTSLCCIPVGIPLLIVWIKPETKRWYGA
jgi:hypothetical protein